MRKLGSGSSSGSGGMSKQGGRDLQALHFNADVHVF